MPISIRRKLKSRKGASITFALLAFLVCAVLGAVVIAAASAAGGRVKDLAEMDQRYYAVTSAAQLFREELDKQTFTIERVEDSRTYLPITHTKLANGTVNSVPGTETAEPSNPTFYSLKITLPKASEDDTGEPVTVTADTKKESLLTEAALRYVLGSALDGNLVNQTSLEAIYGLTPGTATQTWNMTAAVTGEGGAISTLTVQVTATMSANGDIRFIFANTPAEAGGEVFTVEFTLKASVQDHSATPSVTKREGQPRDVNKVSDTVYTETIHYLTTSTKTTSITWNATDIKKG